MGQYKIIQDHKGPYRNIGLAREKKGDTNMVPIRTSLRNIEPSQSEKLHRHRGHEVGRAHPG